MPWAWSAPIRSRASSSSTARPRRRPERRGARALFTLTSLAALLVGLAALLLIGYNWEAMPSAVKLAIIFAVLLATHCGAFQLRYRLGNRTASEIAFFLACLFYGAAIWLVAQIFHINAGGADGFWWWALGVLPFALGLDTLLLHALLVALLALYLGFSTFGPVLSGRGMALVPGTPRPGWLQRAPAGPAGDPLGLSQVVAADRRPLRPAAGLVGDPATLRLAVRGQPGLLRGHRRRAAPARGRVPLGGEPAGGPVPLLRQPAGGRGPDPAELLPVPAVARLRRQRDRDAGGDDPGRRPGPGSGRPGRRARPPHLGQAGLAGRRRARQRPPPPGADRPDPLLDLPGVLEPLLSAPPWSPPCWPTSRSSRSRSG